MNIPVPLKQTKKGEYIRLKDSETATVYIRGHYDAATKSYSLTKADDMNAEIFRKASTPVYIGFTY